MFQPIPLTWGGFLGHRVRVLPDYPGQQCISVEHGTDLSVISVVTGVTAHVSAPVESLTAGECYLTIIWLTVTHMISGVTRN